MRIHIIACRVLSRDLSRLAADSPEIVDITWLPQGLHDTPDRLRQTVQEAIDQIEQQLAQKVLKHRPDAIALGYGLCSNGVIGLRARTIPLIVPRTDDCIALFLGSQARYLTLFDAYPGTFWLNHGWLESCYGENGEWWLEPEGRREEYAELYGEENADFLIEQETAWIRNYKTCTYIHSHVFEKPAYPACAKRIAGECHWQFREENADDHLLRALTEGSWTDAEFLTCPPGYQIEAVYDGTKFSAVPTTQG